MFAVTKQTLLTNGKVLTLDESQPLMEAILIRDGRIAYVGSAQEALARASGGTEIIDLAGRSVLPGFVDSHMHPSLFGTTLLEIDCRFPAVKCIDDILRRVEEKARAEPPGTWIRGWGYDDSN